LIDSAIIGIIDYSAGNLSSMFNALDACGLKWKRISSLEHFSNYSHLILPGVGAFGHGMGQLNEKGFTEKINEEIAKGVPFLGICLGMQLLFEYGNEFGRVAGLGAIKGEVKPMSLHCGNLIIPHVGWNDVVAKKKSLIIPEISLSAYFVHSYFCECSNAEDIAAVTDYGGDFCSVVERSNIFGVQFHPEKSHKRGLDLLKSFGSI
jgi:glutamine amidotransferase